MLLCPLLAKSPKPSFNVPAKPVVGLTADVKQIDPHPYHCVGDKYLRAVVDAAGAIPVIMPALDEVAAADWLDLLDGVVLTGSYANVHPSRYGGPEPDPDSPLDVRRDAANLSLIPAALKRGIPLLGICRGFQEMNVALGGTLHARVHEVAGFNDHREDPDQPLDVQYGPSHAITVCPGGMLATIAGGSEQQVNSLHGQAVDQLAPGVTVEARAHDGLVEAFSVDDAEGFALAVQWHPEWRPADSAFYTRLWRAFGDACRGFAARRGNASRVA